MTTLFRRHVATCPHRAKGRVWLKCNCPLWSDNGIKKARELRSLGTRDLAEARRMVLGLEQPSEKEIQTSDSRKSLHEALESFLAQGVADSLADATMRKRKKVARYLWAFCEHRGIINLDGVTLETLSAYRADRKISLLTGAKELETLKHFFRFCFDRRWVTVDPSAQLKAPRNLKPNEIEPYTPSEIAAMIAACDLIGEGNPWASHRKRSRLRARAMLLTMRYTGLRIGDVALLARDRLSTDAENRWHIYLHTEKSGKPVFLPIPNELRLALNEVPTPRGAPADCRYYFWNGRMSERAMKGSAGRTMHRIFELSQVARAHPHRFRHTLATELLGAGASFEEAADILGNTPAVVRRHYGKWSAARQARIDSLMDRIWATSNEKGKIRRLK